MLKIKDDVDLKELEKFGFKPKYDEDTGNIIRYILPKDVSKQNENPKYITKAEIIFVSDIENYGDYFKQHEVEYWKICYWEFEVLPVLYDLIQANLVEKVEG